MPEIKILAIKKEQTLTLVMFFTLLAIATFAPYLKIQFLTGPIVNAVLIISTVLLGVESAIFIGLLPSLYALAVGLLPAVLAPMIPFIMTANAILIVVFNFLFSAASRSSVKIGTRYWLGILSASFLKFLFLFLTSQIVVNLLIKKEIASKVAVMMSWPQLFTALAGGALAYLFLKGLKKI